MRVTVSGSAVEVRSFPKSSKSPFARTSQAHTIDTEAGAEATEFAKTLTHAALSTKRIPNHATLHVVVNPNSGTGQAVSIWEKTKAFLDFFGIQVSHHTTTAPLHASEIGAALQLGDADIACTIGGDGVMHELVNGIAKQKKRTTVALIPAGTGNGMVSTLGIRSYEDAVWALVHGTRVPLDALKVTQQRPMHRHTAGQDLPEEPKERYGFLHMCYGLIADVDFDSEWLRWLGAARFPITAVMKMVFLSSYPARLRMVLAQDNKKRSAWEPALAAEGQEAQGPPFEPAPPSDQAKTLEIEDDLLCLQMSNVAEISEGMMTNPFARLADGYIDVTLVRRSKAGRMQIIDFFNRVESTSCADAPYIEHYKATTLTLTPLASAPSKGKLDLDGEWIPYGEVTMSCCPSSLQIVAP